MAAIFQIRRGSGSADLVDGELYVNKGPDSLQYTIGTREITLAKLDELNTGSLNLYGDLTASNLYVTGNVKIDGKITVGNETGDTLNIVASLSSSLIPSDHKSFDIGSNSKWYKNLYVETISSSFISGAIAGIGSIEVFSASVDNRLDRVEASASLYDNAMSGSNRLYVSPSGSDSYDGKDPSTPFRTIKAAVESLGSAVYTNTKRHTIFVGSGEYTEQNPIALPPGVAIVGDTLRTVRLTASNPTKDYFHCHDGNYFYGLRFLNLRNPSFSFSYPCSTATASISGGSISSIGVVHSMTGYTDGNNQDLGIIIEGPDASGSIATATANVVSGVITQINVVSGGTNYSTTEKPHISIPAPIAQRPIIGTSPYIQNCSSITGPFTTDGTLLSLIPGNANYAALPYNINDVRNQSNAVIGSGVIDEQGAGGGIRIDGNLVHPNSPLESFVADAFTQVNQCGPGHLVINKGYAQFVSCFTTFCTYGFKTANGGFANISNSVIDFGKYGLISKTYFPQTYNTGSSLETKTSQVSGFIIDENGAGYTGSIAGVTITGGGASVQATAQASVNANGSIDEIVLLTGGSGYTTQPSVTIATPTGPGAIQATTVSGKALITGVSEILMSLQSGSRGIDISSNMILNGVDYLVTDVAAVSGQPNQRRVTTYPAPPSIVTNAQIKFHQLSNISTGGLVMEYVGSGVTYNALPKYGGVPIRTREINEYAPGRVFYSTVDNIGNLKIGDFFSVNQLTGEVTIDANSFNLSGLNAIGPFKRNGVAVGVVLQEVSNNTTLLNSQGLYGEDTVPTQYAVKEYVNTYTSSANVRLNNLEITSASVKTSIAELNSYTQSLKTAITVDGVNTTILGNLAILGTTTTVNSNEVNIGDNILHLNYGYSATEAGIEVTDVTGGSQLSGSLLWDGTTDYWKAGKKGVESKILLAGGDGVLSSSLQLTQLNQFTQSLNDFSASVTASLEKIYQTTSSLNLFSASVTASLVSINDTTASLNTSITNINLTTASLNTSITNINLFTQSANIRLTELETASGSAKTSISSLNAYTNSLATRWDNLQTYTTSVDSRFTRLENYTGSVNQTTASLNLFTASTSQSLWYLYSSSTNHEERIDYIEGIGGISGGSPLGPLNTFSASINSFTSSINTTIKTKLDLDGVLSGSTQLIGLLPAGVVSGSSQVNIYDVENFATFNDAIAFDIGEKLFTSSFNEYTASQSTGSLVTSISNLNNATSSYETKGRGIWSGSAQLPSGVVSGSAQVITANSITLGTHTTGNYVQTVTGDTANGLTVAGSGLESADVTLTLAQSIKTDSNPQFNSLGIGMVASTTAGRIDASGDIVAYSTSDERLKENLQPIQNALSKVETISGNEYNWKEEFESIHGFKGNDVGVIAQEIEKILPQAVMERDNGYLGVNYEKIIPLLIEAIKELSVKVTELENK